MFNHLGGGLQLGLVGAHVMLEFGVSSAGGQWSGVNLGTAPNISPRRLCRQYSNGSRSALFGGY